VLPTVGGIVAVVKRFLAAQRRWPKNSSSRAAASSAITPATISTRWFRRGSCGMLYRLQAAPARGSGAP